MKIKNIAILTLFSIALAALAIFAAGCSDEDGYNPETWKGAVVTFVLEGGEYKNSKNNVEYYFSLDEGESVRIDSPAGYSKKAITRPDYRLDEWCRTRQESDGAVIYSDAWNFDTDVVNYGDRITLYAHWSRLVKYTYNVCYRDANGETVIVGTYEVDEGARFNDYSKYSNKIQNSPHEKTALPDSNGNIYFDENDQPWNNSFRHPGGDEDTAINVYLHYIEGIYTLVYDADDLNSVSSSSNVYLMNDIDYDGETLISLNDYRGIFVGNGHTVKNFNINRGSARDGSYGKDDVVQDSSIDDGRLICISIFGNAVGADISDVAFENVSIDVNVSYSGVDKVIVAPLFVKMAEYEGGIFDSARVSSVKNVSFQGEVKISSLNPGLDRDEDVIIVTDRMYYIKDAASVIGNGCTVNFVESANSARETSVDLFNEQFTSKKEQ